MGRRGDALFELTDAISCGSCPVTDLAHLSLELEHRRGHGALYDAVNAGVLDTVRLRALLCAGPLPRITGPDGRDRIVLAVDVSNCLRPDAATSPGRLFCHTYARGRGQAQMIPGWPYSLVAVLEAGASSWTALLDVVRIVPDDEATAVTATQLRRVLDELTRAGHYRPGDPEVLVVTNAGYDVIRLGRLLADPLTHPVAVAATVNDTTRHGHAQATASARMMHPGLESRGRWAEYASPLPIIEGTVVGLRVERLPGNSAWKPVWLWVSKPAPDSDGEIDHWWSMFIRRFDLEHTFRLLKQALGWTRPHLREPEAADRWSWLILAAHTQLRLDRALVAHHRLPWQPPLAPTRLTPPRVRAGYRRVCATAARPARTPKPTRAGPGRPRGRRNRIKAPVHCVGKPS